MYGLKMAKDGLKNSVLGPNICFVGQKKSSGSLYAADFKHVLIIYNYFHQQIRLKSKAWCMIGSM